MLLKDSPQAMADAKRTPPVKVCYTCRYWSAKYKGLCQRLNQGVGKFYSCADWAEANLEKDGLDEPLLKEAAAAFRR
jgi:hypothetical protein